MYYEPTDFRHGSPYGTVLEGVGGDYLEGRILMMETGRAWWVIFVQGKLQLCRGYLWVRMNWGHWRPRAGVATPLVRGGIGLVEGGGGVGLEGNIEGVKQVFAPLEFVCLGPILGGFIPCSVYRSQIYNTSLFLLRMNSINQIILKTGALPCP